MFALIAAVVAGTAVLLFIGTTLKVRVSAAADRRWASASGDPYFAHFGEAFVGQVHLKRPWAHLTGTSTALRFAFAWRTYEFPRAAIERLGQWNPLWPALAIRHSIENYPARFVFLPKDIRTLAAELESLGYAFEPGYLGDVAD